ncbi:hypothetical protein BEWA_002660 [Theileria equi strain WA]|uniref:Nuclear migration protein nudC n=1 Tax=Theileria equi strain WA TaxID=1537102 RepID=L0B155_THEEQ|nr:hypothetical protein BEWA_002660 [Theileria equi strain WA]AFZ80859.1 hypothetical protein BEWA_002660 [Theileria equi strain WA]|eukprot:XP_004830525.1 hypothetical protein BEWA_002660 [Theileria equi strain WA]
MAEESLDSLFLLLTEKSGGVESLLEGFFSFLRRRTDFYKPPNQGGFEASLDHCVNLVSKYCRKAGNEYRELMNKQAAAQTSVVKETPASSISKVPRIEEIHPDPPVVKAVTPSAPVTSSSDTPEEDDGEEEVPPPGNGGSTDKYDWTQTLGALEVLVPVPAGTPSKLVSVKITTNTLHVTLNKEPLFGGELHDAVKSDECLWALVDGRVIQISLEKRNGMQWWPCVIKGDQEIDVKKIVPENSKLSDLDPETRATVERMMFDQRQKAAGLPTSSQQSQFEALEKFKKAHPELDFSKANISYN